MGIWASLLALSVAAASSARAQGQPASEPAAADQNAPESNPTEPSANCPPGWYCEPPPADEATTEVGPVAQPEPEQQPGAATKDAAAAPAQPADEQLESPPPSWIDLRAEPPPPPRPRAWPKFGISGRLSVGLLDHRRGEEAGIGGLGLSLRYRPARAVTLDFGLDAFHGDDYAGDERTEGALSASAVLFPASRSRLRPYLLAGLFTAAAQVQTPGEERDYVYVGGQLGLGMELRLSERWELYWDLVGFVRSRVDDETQRPEFTDPTSGRSTNDSGGGLFRFGTVFAL